MINFAALEENINTCIAQQKEMATTLRKLETTVATLATKAEVDELDQKTKEAMSKMQRAIEKLDVSQMASAQIVHEMPSLQRDLTGRMSELEQRLSKELATQKQDMGQRISAAESDVRNKAAKSEVAKLKSELEERVKRDEVDQMQNFINKIRDEASDRIDAIGERTFNMRKELDSSLDQVQSTTTLVQQRVEERTHSLEEQAKEVSTFLAKAEKQIASKVANEELNRLSSGFAEQLQETRNVLQAQMDLVRGRAERSAEDFERVVGKLEAAAMRSDLFPVKEHVEKLQVDLDELVATVETKAIEEDVVGKFEELIATDHELKQLINTKADHKQAAERHEQHANKTTGEINALREVTEHLGISINSVEESVNLVGGQTATKAETRDVHEMMKMNEAVQSQVATLKQELQGTLKALETWILEQNNKNKGGGMKLQQKPEGKPKDAGVQAGMGRQLRGGLGAATDGPFGGNYTMPANISTASAYGGGHIDATGTFAMPADKHQPMLSPRPPPPRKKGGGAAGIMGGTASYAASKSGAGRVVVAGGGEDEQGPPFRSQADRRQWLLQEKRRWLVEMRLNGTESDAKLPPIGMQQLSDGTDLNALVSPR